MKAKPWLVPLCLLLTGQSQAADALDPDFVEYLVQFADDKEVFDAADYALISQTPAKSAATDDQPVQQAARPIAKEPKP